MRILTALAIAAMAATAAFPASAQDFPNKPVQMIVPFPPGGGTDILGRIVAKALSEKWGQPVVVENRPGASGAIGAKQAMQAAGDGYTLLMASTGTLLTLAEDVPEGETFDVNTMLTPLSQVAAPPYMLVVNPKVEAKTVDEFIALAKKEPRKITYGSSGVGSASHLTGALFEDMAGVELLHIPYKGTGQAVTDLLSGEVSAMFGPAPTLQPHIAGGSLRAIALTSTGKSALFPEMTTVAETLKGYESVGWFGLYLPPKADAAIVKRVNEDIVAVLNDEAVKKEMAQQSAEPAPMTPEQYGTWVNDDIRKWLAIMKKAKG